MLIRRLEQNRALHRPVTFVRENVHQGVWSFCIASAVYPVRPSIEATALDVNGLYAAANAIAGLQNAKAVRIVPRSKQAGCAGEPRDSCSKDECVVLRRISTLPQSVVCHVFEMCSYTTLVELRTLR